MMVLLLCFSAYSSPWLLSLLQARRAGVGVETVKKSERKRQRSSGSFLKNRLGASTDGSRALQVVALCRHQVARQHTSWMQKQRTSTVSQFVGLVA
jgi:hypothetical protein